MKKILLGALGVLVVAGVAIAVVFALLPRGGSSAPVASAAASTSPSSLPGPSATPRTTTLPSTSPPPVTPGGGPGAGSAGGGTAAEPSFGSGSAPTSVACPVPGEGPAGSTAESPEVQLTWSGSAADTAFVGVDTTDARAEPYSEVSTTGSVSIPFACPAASHTYTVTLVGAGGQRSKTFTVQNTGYRG